MRPRRAPAASTVSRASVRARLGTALALASVLPAASALANRSSGSGGGGGMLDAARSEVHGGSSSPSSSASSTSPSSSSDSGSYYDGSGAYGGTGGLVSAPTRTPVATSLRNEPWYFRRHPYEGGRPGHLLFLSQLAPGELGPSDALQPPGAPPTPRSVSVQLGVELGYDLAGIYRPAARVRLETRWLVGLEAGWTHLIEPLPHAGPAPGPRGSVDHFGVGDVSALVHARWNKVTIWSGLGLRVLADVNRPSDGGDGAALGWAGAVGLRLFPVRPLLVNTRLDFGSLGEASVLRARVELGAILRCFELYGGYDYFAIGDVKFHGPLAGLRFWL